MAYHNMVFYSNESLANYSLSESSIEALTTIGLPVIDTPYHKFFPSNTVNRLIADKNEYLILGNNFRRELSGIDNVILLNAKDGIIYFLSNSFYEIGYIPSPFLAINSDINTFLIFNLELYKFIENHLLKEEKEKFEDIIFDFSLMLTTMKATDSVRLAPVSNDSFYWRKRIYELASDISEIYEVFFDPFSL